MYKAVIFDAGGVLQTYEVMKPIYDDICETLKITYEQLREVWNDYSDLLGRGEIEEHEFWEALIERTGSTIELPEESLLLREYKKRFEINQETLNVVQRLKERGYKLAVFTNTMKMHSQYNKEMGLYDPFEVRVLSDEIGSKKPEKKGFEICLQKLGVRAEEAIFVDDLERNLIPARELGITGIQFISPEQLVYELKQLGLSLS